MSDTVFLDAGALKDELVQALANSPLLNGGCVAERLHLSELNQAVAGQLEVMLKRLDCIQTEALRLMDLKKEVSALKEATEKHLATATEVVANAEKHQKETLTIDYHLSAIIALCDRQGLAIVPRAGPSLDCASMFAGNVYCSNGNGRRYGRIGDDAAVEAYRIMVEKLALTVSEAQQLN